MPKQFPRFIFLILLLSPLALAQRTEISPQAIVVNPVPSFDVDVWVDRAPTGGSVPTYQVGEPIRVGVRTEESGYVYLFSVSAGGDVVQILPNRHAGGGDAFMAAGETRHFPPAGARYTFNVAAPHGLAKVVAISSKQPLDTRTLASFRNEGDLHATAQLGQEGFIEAMAIVVRPLPQDSWVSAAAEFYVGSRPQPVAPRPAPTMEPLNAYLGLMPYPNSTVTRQKSDRKDSESSFTSSARLRDIYDHFHRQLVQNGWRRTDLDRDDDEIEAEYRRGREKFELELEAKNRNRFELEIDFD